jgi:Ras-related protein Rab-27A
MGFLLVFDVTNETSFLNVRNWIGEIQSNAYSENVDMILVGNKCDLEKERIITKSRAIEFAQQCQIDYIETSALENLNVAESIELLLDSVINHLEENENFSKSNPNLPKLSSGEINQELLEKHSRRKNTSSFCCNY